MDVKEILNAWVSSFNPTEMEKKRAEDRFKICTSPCTYLQKSFVFDIKCGACGCPVSRKVYSHKFNPCPLAKWEDVDKKYMKPIETKKTKTLF